MQNAKNQREEVNVKKLYGNECLLPKDDFIKQYHIGTVRCTLRNGRSTVPTAPCR